MTRIVALLLFVQACNSCSETTQTAPRSDAQQTSADARTLTDAALFDAGASFDDFPDAGTDLETRARHLLEAISQNDASLAADIVLPREAYIAARDSQDPAGLYDGKFRNTFAAQIAHIHHREKGIDQAIFVSFALGQNPERAVPRKHDWKEPVWRVVHSTLTFTVDGRVRRFEIAEMIAWRGNWYITHLR